MIEKLKNFKWGYVILFVLLAAVGVCFLCLHDTLPTVALIMGIILTIYGIIMAVYAIARRERDAQFAFKITMSVIAIFAGIATMIFRNQASGLLASLISLFLIIDGSFKLHTAAMSKRYKLTSWLVMLIPAVLIIIGGYVTLEYITDIAALSVVLGITIIIDAIANLLSAFYISGYEKRNEAEFKAKYSPEHPQVAEAEETEQNALPEADSDKLPEEASHPDIELEFNETEPEPADTAVSDSAESAPLEMEITPSETDKTDGEGA